MDDDTAKTILAIQIEDLKSSVSSQKGKAAEGCPPTDSEVAVDLQLTELENQMTKLSDSRMAHSMSHAVQDDGVFISILNVEERRSVQDRQMALRMSGKTNDESSNVPDCHVDEDMLLRLNFLSIRRCDDQDAGDDRSLSEESIFTYGEQDTGESSARAASRGRNRAMMECVACFEIQETLQVPCGHQYCTSCLVTLVNDSTTDESLFPPRCCAREMPMSLISPYLTAEMTKNFEQTAIEFNSPYRTYCYSCGLFVSPHSINGHQAHCKACSQDTCMLCKSQYHHGDCPRDADLEAILRLSQENGWQRCTGCQAMVERGEGCNHMT